MMSALADSGMQTDSEFADRAAAVSEASSMGGPSTLSEYCSGAGAAVIKDKQPVEANWKNFGEFYPGEVKEVNDDGSVDVLYNDGWVEKNIDEKEVKPIDTNPEGMKAKDDPACQLKDDIEKVKKTVKSAFGEVAKFMAGQRASESSAQKPRPRPMPVAVAGAPAGAIPTEEPNDALRALLAELAELDEEIADLLKITGEKDALIEQELKEDQGPLPAMWTLEDQIKDIQQKLKRRERELARLRDQNERRDAKLAALSPVSLSAIGELVKAIDVELEQLKVKRDALEKNGQLDDELRHGVDTLITNGGQLSTQVFVLIEAANQAALSGSKAAEAEVLKAADAVTKEMKKVKEGTQELDEGVHPHGDKWWRYRYEHCYLEAFLMIWVCLLMILWERLYYYMRRKAYRNSEANEFDELTSGTMYIIWLEHAAGELMVCLLVFLTIWVFAQLGLWDCLKWFFIGSTLHVPHSGREYRHLALDVCVILFFAVVFYFILVLSIVHATTQKLADWEVLETQQEANKRPLMYGASTPSEYDQLKKYFITNVNRDRHLRKTVPPLTQSFPLWKYMRVSVRENTDDMFKFGGSFWLLILSTFIIFMCLHRFAHVGYIRIMSVFLGFMGLILGAMMLFIRRVSSNALSTKEPTDDCAGAGQPLKTPSEISGTPRTIHQKVATEKIMAMILSYVLFFLCYGTARFICQKWMWVLHFYPVLIMTVLSVLMAVFFAGIVAPMIPIFAATMAMPPYIDPSNLQNIQQFVEDVDKP